MGGEGRGGALCRDSKAQVSSLGESRKRKVGIIGLIVGVGEGAVIASPLGHLSIEGWVIGICDHQKVPLVASAPLSPTIII